MCVFGMYMYLGELLTGKMLMHDALFGDFTELELSGREPKCAVCGDHPTITELKSENYEPVLCHN